MSSYISKIDVDIGDVVTKGQVWAELEAPELIANLTAAYFTQQSHNESVRQLAEYLKITTYFAGVVSDRRLSPGAFVARGTQNAVPLL